ncbi:helix-turn-helix domain-containing protein [Mediterraneibacter glycyrrhizinilyticus]|uniref:helix-turn-helix domain-containing protein n=1 Tax=Mediterraneibacter glycyrrhizinilyticus TaxID=342942 RepID=UPI00195F7B4D|nr:helix-turn-helix domain-containing protein [Mediterraneibacter glycyrrhizinilyticus]MBM6751315.1 helix-turn-helix domain-containing protein [Mediterraneibacter glycyrrhizinilyticus]
MISYAPLWKTLKDKHLSTYWLLNHGVNSKTLYNLKHNKNTTLLTIEKLCHLLECEITDIIEFVDDPPHN